MFLRLFFHSIPSPIGPKQRSSTEGRVSSVCLGLALFFCFLVHLSASDAGGEDYLFSTIRRLAPVRMVMMLANDDGSGSSTKLT